MATAHLIFGRVGAGKTTYGRKLAAERRALFCCLDEWMATLYLMDAPSPMTYEWALERVQRAERQIVAVAAQALAIGGDVVLELGFFTRAQRDRVRGALGGAAAEVQVQAHVLDVPADVRRERVRQRNRGGANFTIEVSDATFDWAEQHFEPLGDDEQRGAVVAGS